MDYTITDKLTTEGLNSNRLSPAGEKYRLEEALRKSDIKLSETPQVTVRETKTIEEILNETGPIDEFDRKTLLKIFHGSSNYETNEAQAVHRWIKDGRTPVLDENKALGIEKGKVKDIVAIRAAADYFVSKGNYISAGEIVEKGLGNKEWANKLYLTAAEDFEKNGRPEDAFNAAVRTGLSSSDVRHYLEEAKKHCKDKKSVGNLLSKYITGMF